MWEGGLAEYRYTKWQWIFGTAEFEYRLDLKLQHCSFRGDGVAVLYGVPMDAHIFCARFYVPPQQREPNHAARTKKTLVQKVREKLPWLLESEIERHLEETEGDEEEEDPTPPDDGELEERAEHVVEDLAEARARADDPDEELDTTDFYTKAGFHQWNRGGSHGPYHRIACLARTHTSKFCAIFGVTVMHSFAMEKFGGEDNCLMLARGWVEKLSYYFLLFVSNGEAVEDFTLADHEGFSFSDAFLDWAVTLPVDSEAFKAVVVLQKFRPSL